MANSRVHAEALFQRLKSGDQDAFVDLVEVGRTELFDYLFRMSGQRDTVMRVIDESVVALSADAWTKFSSLDDVYAAVYATTRSFCSHIWNADTSELINDGYENLDLASVKPQVKKNDVEAAEQVLSRIPGWEREPILLYVRSGFSFELIAKIMSSSRKAVEDGFNSGLIKLAQACRSGDPAVLVELVRHIPFHPASQRSSHHTMALSQIMGDIDKVKSPWLSSKSMLVLAGLLGCVAWFVLKCRT